MSKYRLGWCRYSSPNRPPACGSGDRCSRAQRQTASAVDGVTRYLSSCAESVTRISCNMAETRQSIRQEAREGSPREASSQTFIDVPRKRHSGLRADWISWRRASPYDER